MNEINRWLTPCLAMPGNCCSSCHEDVGMGYNIGEIYLEDNLILEHCCYYTKEEVLEYHEQNDQYKR